MEEMSEFEQKAWNYAFKCHEDTNHRYDGWQYIVHLKKVRDVAEKFKHLLPHDHEVIFASSWLHDVIEDTRQTYNDVKKVVGKQVADVVYALTNEKGKNRKERANKKYYDGIRANNVAIFVKTCDRIANMEYSAEFNTRMAKMYVKELPEFEKELKMDDFEQMWDYIYDLESKINETPIKLPE